MRAKCFSGRQLGDWRAVEQVDSEAAGNDGAELMAAHSRWSTHPTLASGSTPEPALFLRPFPPPTPQEIEMLGTSLGHKEVCHVETTTLHQTVQRKGPSVGEPEVSVSKPEISGLASKVP